MGVFYLRRGTGSRQSTAHTDSTKPRADVPTRRCRFSGDERARIRSNPYHLAPGLPPVANAATKLAGLTMEISDLGKCAASRVTMAAASTRSALWYWIAS